MVTSTNLSHRHRSSFSPTHAVSRPSTARSLRLFHSHTASPEGVTHVVPIVFYDAALAVFAKTTINYLIVKLGCVTSLACLLKPPVKQSALTPYSDFKSRAQVPVHKCWVFVEPVFLKQTFISHFI